MSDPTDDATLDVEEILSEPSADYVDTPRCIRSIRSTDVIDSQHITFRTGRDTYYLVQLAFPCPGLRRNSSIMLESNNSRLCELDTVRSVDVGRHTGPPCQIPGFQQITREQLALLKERLKLKRSGDLIDEIDPTDIPTDPGREEHKPASG